MTGARQFSTKVEVDRAVASLAARQHGLVSRRQTRVSGLSDSALRYAVRTGRFEPLHPGVFRVAAAPFSWEQSVLAACLWGDPGTYASHTCAAAIWGLDGFVPGLPVISSTQNLRPDDGRVRVHRVGRWLAYDIDSAGGIPVTSPTRTLLDLAGAVGPARLEVGLDDSLRRRLTTIEKLGWRVEDMAGRGTAGVRLLRRLLAERTSGAPLPESALERRVLRLLEEAGLPPPQLQVEIRDGAKFIARVDLAYLEHRLVIEVDGYRFHSGKAVWEHDRVRRNALQALGLTVLNVTHQQLVKGGADFVRTVRAIMGAEGFSGRECTQSATFRPENAAAG